LEYLVIDGGIIIKLVLRKQCVRVWTGFIWLGIRTGSSTEPSGSIKDGKILTSRAAILASQDELCSIKLFTCHNLKYNRLPLPWSPASLMMEIEPISETLWF
jgi:hypothetical protein